jgi:hypothetical protein
VRFGKSLAEPRCPSLRAYSAVLPGLCGRAFRRAGRWRVAGVIAFHEKTSRSQVVSFVFSLDMIFSPPSRCPPLHPHSDERFRSVQVGRSRFSRCCHLIVDLPFHLLDWKLGQAINAVTGTRRLGFCVSSRRTFCLYAAAGIAFWSLLRNGSYTPPLTHKR